MSLAVAVVCPEGLVLAADSRVTLYSQIDSLVVQSNFDNATKLLTLKSPHNHIAITTVGSGTIGGRTIHSFLKELETELGQSRKTVKNYAKKLKTFYQNQWDAVEHSDDEQPIVFLVGGLNDGKLYGEVYEVVIPIREEVNKVIGEGEFNFAWRGDATLVTRLVNGIDPNISSSIDGSTLSDSVKAELAEIIKTHVGSNIPTNIYTLQDSIDLARFLISTTINAQKLSQTQRTVGGNIDTCVITHEKGCSYISRKELS